MKTSDFRFYYPEAGSGNFDAETRTGIIERQEAIDDFIRQQKSGKTNKREGYTDMNTLLRCMEANSMENEKIESFLASELDQLFSKKQCHIINNLLTSLARVVLGIVSFGRFCTDLATLGPYCHDLGPILPSTALALG